MAAKLRIRQVEALAGRDVDTRLGDDLDFAKVGLRASRSIEGMLELETRREMLTKGFQLEIAAAEARFNEKLRTVINQFARDQEFSVILERGAVAYSAASVDITTAVIDLFNRMYPGAAGGSTGN